MFDVVGLHRVEVQFAGRQIDGSPFYVDVFDLLSIRVTNFQQGGIGEQASFTGGYIHLVNNRIFPTLGVHVYDRNLTRYFSCVIILHHWKI